MQNVRHSSFICLILCTLVFASTPSSAQNTINAQLVRAEGVKHNNFSRLIFRLDDAGNFNVVQQERKLTITFDNPVNGTLDNLLSSLKQDIKDANFSADNKSIILTLNRSNIRIRKFIGENFIGVDLVTIEDDDANQVSEIVSAENNNPISILPKILQKPSLTQAPANTAGDSQFIVPQRKPVLSIGSTQEVPPLNQTEADTSSQTAPEQSSNTGTTSPPEAIPSNDDPQEEDHTTQEETAEDNTSTATEALASEDETLVAEQSNTDDDNPTIDGPTTANENTESPTTISDDEATAQEKEDQDNAQLADDEMLDISEVINKTANAKTDTDNTLLLTDEMSLDPSKTSSKKPTITTPKGIVNVGRERIGNGIKLVFPWQERVAAAMYARSNNIWVLFTEPSKLKLDNIKGIKYIESLKQIKHDRFTILRIILNDEYQIDRIPGTQQNLVNIRSYVEERQWALEIQEDDPEIDGDETVANPVTIASGNTDKGAKVFIQAPRTAKTLNLIDLEVGDTLVIIPLYTSETGVATTRRYIDFTLLQTAQGVVIQKVADGLQYRIDKEDISISSTEGLHVSSELFTQEQENQQQQTGKRTKRTKKVVLPSQSVFPFEPDIVNLAIEEEGEDIEDTTENADTTEVTTIFDERDDLYRKLNAAAENDKTQKRLEIAKYYFAHGLFSESLGVLREIKILDPTYEGMQEIDLIIAASHYMLQRYEAAETEFRQLAQEAEEHESYDEIRLWHWSSAFQQSKGQREKNKIEIPVDYVASYDQFMQQYPKSLRYSFGLLAVEEEITKERLDAAKTILEIISYDEIPEEFVNDTKYLRGIIKELDGDLEGARETWTKLAEDVSDRYNRARATFALTRSKLIHGEMTVDEAVDVFSQLSMVWRGDGFELDLLKLIGQLYIKEKDYIKGLKAWQVLVSNFPNTKEALFIAGKMKKTFIKLFDEGEAYNLPPFQALSLYFEFRELTPVGERGDRIIQQLAEHFINADLLENATALITHQVKFRASGEQKNMLALKLADLHLKNRKPDLTFEALAHIEAEAATEEMLLSAKYLRAKAHIARSEFKETIDILSDDFSKEAEDLRLDVFWAQKNWFGIMRIIEARLPKIRETAPFELTEAQTEDVIRLALAYATQEYRSKLRILQEEFGSRINNAKANNIFTFVTHDIPAVNHKAFEKTVQLQDIELFMNEYAFWPGKDWKNSASILATRIKEYKRSEPPLTEEEKKDIVRLGLAYTMLLNHEDQQTAKDAKRGLSELNRDFKGVVVDKDTVNVFRILDDKFLPKEEDAIFEESIALKDIPEFVPRYQSARKISELNTANQQAGS